MKARLLTRLPEIHTRLTRAHQILLFSDYDGTLTPIVNRPADARLPEDTRATLTTLSRCERVRVAILSGRSLEDLRTRIGISGLIYAGNHGLEISGPHLHFSEPAAEAARESLRRITDKLIRSLSPVKGVWVEHKGLTTSVHFRMVRDSEQVMVIHLVEEVTKESSGFRITEGRKVREIRPAVEWNKGKAALWIAKEIGAVNFMPLCLGDDRTDEDTFAAFPQGVRIRVGSNANTLAEYYAEDTGQIHRFLSWLVDNTAGHGRTDSIGIEI